MVDDCRNRFWLLARAVEDNGSTLRPKVARQSLVVKGFAISGLNPLDHFKANSLWETRRRSVVPLWKNQE